MGTGLEGEDDDSILWNQLGSKCGMNHSMIPACCRRWNTQNPETLIVAVHEKLCFCSLAFVCFFLSLLNTRGSSLVGTQGRDEESGDFDLPCR